MGSAEGEADIQAQQWHSWKITCGKLSVYLCNIKDGGDQSYDLSVRASTTATEG